MKITIEAQENIDFKRNGKSNATITQRIRRYIKRVFNFKKPKDKLILKIKWKKRQEK